MNFELKFNIFYITSKTVEMCDGFSVLYDNMSIMVATKILYTSNIKFSRKAENNIGKY